MTYRSDKSALSIQIEIFRPSMVLANVDVRARATVHGSCASVSWSDVESTTIQVMARSANTCAYSREIQYGL